jgi:hypothetical protein
MVSERTQGLSIRQVKDEFEMYLFKKLPGSERGTVTLPLIEKPHLLPIPFPRGMFVSEHFRLSATGLRQTLPTTT